ncbi:MAG: hypothetical protein M1814_006000 [Vezdaea aestivalis]|nr:MAG: hypothetical protein M1814_006000 [Vezdaea aestivalis]
MADQGAKRRRFAQASNAGGFGEGVTRQSLFQAPTEPNAMNSPLIPWPNIGHQGMREAQTPIETLNQIRRATDTGIKMLETHLDTFMSRMEIATNWVDSKEAAIKTLLAKCESAEVRLDARARLVQGVSGMPVGHPREADSRFQCMESEMERLKTQMDKMRNQVKKADTRVGTLEQALHSTQKLLKSMGRTMKVDRIRLDSRIYALEDPAYTTEDELESEEISSEEEEDEEDEEDEGEDEDEDEDEACYSVCEELKSDSGTSVSTVAPDPRSSSPIDGEAMEME